MFENQQQQYLMITTQTAVICTKGDNLPHSHLSHLGSMLESEICPGALNDLTHSKWHYGWNALSFFITQIIYIWRKK